jgi:MSHA biogenesis protein MshQ
VTARNFAGGTTKNYSDGFAHAVVLAPWDAPGSSNLQNPPSAPSGSALSNPGVAAASFLLGVASTASPAYAFPFAYPAPGVKLAAPTDIHLRAVEAADGITSARGSASVEGGLKVVSGRFLIANNYGSGLQPLPIKVTAQYWGGKAFVDSTTDSVSGFNLTNVVPDRCKGSLLDARTSACKLTLLVAAPSPFVLNNGISGFKLNPAGAGSVDLTINAPAYLPNTRGRATFGVARSGPIIYIGEIY